MTAVRNHPRHRRARRFARPAGGVRGRKNCRRRRGTSGRSPDRSESTIARSCSAGFKVYREVCQVCHGLKLLAFRNLAEPGGPGFTTAQAAAIAAEYQVRGEPDDQGEVKDRPGRPADFFPPPFRNDNEARARYNAVPPDLSVIAKARSYERGFPWWVLDMITQYQEHGVDYLTALLLGYEDPPPAGVNVPAGNFYNRVLSRPHARHAAAIDGPAGRIHRRLADDGRAICQGRLGLPDVGGRAASRGAQAHRPAGVPLPRRARRPVLLHQEEGVARRARRIPKSSPRAHRRNIRAPDSADLASRRDRGRTPRPTARVRSALRIAAASVGARPTTGTSRETD